MRVCVTGAAGRLGSATVKALVEAGHDVVAVDHSFRTDLPVPVRLVDLCEPLGIINACVGCDALAHFANHPHNLAGHEQRVYRENCAMNVHAFEAARQTGVKVVLFASSVQAMSGHPGGWDAPAQMNIPYLPIDGDVPPLPMNAYAASKVAGETLLQCYVRSVGFAGVALRFPQLMDPRWLEHFRRRHGPRGIGNPTEAFAFLWFGDAGRLVAHIVARPPAPGQYRCHFPADPTPSNGRPVAELLDQHFAGIPRKNAAVTTHADRETDPTLLDPTADEPQQQQQQQQ